MDAALLWKFGHFTAMFAAVSIFIGQGLLERAVAGSGDVPALRRVLAAEDRFAPMGGGLFLLGIALGIIAALTGAMDLLQPWLISACVLSAVVLIVAFTYHMPNARRLTQLAAASPDEPSRELRTAIDEPVGRAVVLLDTLVWLGLIFVMVVKPFS